MNGKCIYIYIKNECLILADLVFATPLMAMNTFYNQTRQERNKMKSLTNEFFESRKRHALDEKLLKNHQENTHRVSLMKMANATRTFWTQKDALEFINARQKLKNSDEILYLFSFESQPEGTRRYQVADIEIFIQEY